jgi:peptidoglycan/xylan/chitin deacetylase (PgdA/CDA1 family)
VNPTWPLLGLGLAGLATFGTLNPNSSLWGPVIGRGPRHRKSIYLTFDDGPNPWATESILEVLTRESVPATFFMVGRHVAMFPEIARRVFRGGFEVGNHTQSHRKLHALGPRAVRREMESAQDAIRSAIGSNPTSFRAPHGYRTPFVTRVARELGYTTYGWTVGVWDSDRPGADEIRRRVRDKLCPGAVVLLHDGDGYDPHSDRMQTAEALPGIIHDARERGYTFESLSTAGTSAARRDG